MSVMFVFQQHPAIVQQGFCIGAQAVGRRDLRGAAQELVYHILLRAEGHFRNAGELRLIALIAEGERLRAPHKDGDAALLLPGAQAQGEHVRHRGEHGQTILIIGHEARHVR